MNTPSNPRRPAASLLLVGEDSVRVTRKPIRNLYLRVKPPDGHLEVSAPSRARSRDIAAFVRSRQEWIARMRARIAESAGGLAAAPGAAPWTPERLARAERTLRNRLAVLLPRWTAAVGRAPTRIAIRPMTSRWGSCTPATGRIRLNAELAGMPERLLEYVLVHELAHLLVPGHGPRFQALMTRFLPDWKDRRREINRRVL
ncbi:MAG: M48 family metallopeptidase [Aeriscardovia sp.]|nr:M48 family metallopeptidase [Aeriscardovia sp.]